MSDIRKIELLSPAKTVEVGIAAINHGADAVYIGGPGFSAREKALNTISDIEKLCRHAALYDARVYVTMNTLLYDSELESARKMVYDCWNIGVDALIIQDMAFLEMDLPPIPLHASTQCHNMTLDKVQFLEKVGFSQVVLARELSLEQIRHIHAHTTVPLEFFVHGALCVSHSGQCYLSQVIGNRSANRGACAQPCRLPWDLVDDGGKVLSSGRHLLSLKDLNNSAFLEDLIDAGISSFKIEGRLKDIDYVKNITAFYRQTLDGIFAKRDDLRPSSMGCTNVSFKPNPEKSFSRGFTSYFLQGRREDITSPNTPKSMGEYLGEVSWCNLNRIEVKTNEELHNGDGFCFLDKDGVLQGIRADVVKGNTIVSNRQHTAYRGAKIYRNFDNEWQRQVENSVGLRKIDITLTLQEIDNGYRLVAMLPNYGMMLSVDTECDKIEAINPDKAIDNIRKKIMQWGDTIFAPSRLDLQFAVPRLIPASLLGQMKRQLVDILHNDLIERHREQRPLRSPENKQCNYPEMRLTYLGNVINAMAQRFYNRHGVEDVELGVEKTYAKKGIKVMTTKHCVRYANSLCPKQSGVTAKPLYLVNEKGRFRLEFDCAHCQMNIYSE